MCELNIRARSSRPLSLRRCIDQRRIVRRIAVSAFVLAAGLNETPMPPTLLLTILGLNATARTRSTIANPTCQHPKLRTEVVAGRLRFGEVAGAGAVAGSNHVAALHRVRASQPLTRHRRKERRRVDGPLDAAPARLARPGRDSRARRAYAPAVKGNVRAVAGASAGYKLTPKSCPIRAANPLQYLHWTSR
jgi:hypothetical protein